MNRLKVFGVIPGMEEEQLVAEIKAHPALTQDGASRRRIIEHLAKINVDVVSVQVVEEAMVELH